jgi:hypothetical protein
MNRKEKRMKLFELRLTCASYKQMKAYKSWNEMKHDTWNENGKGKL